MAFAAVQLPRMSAEVRRNRLGRRTASANVGGSPTTMEGPESDSNRQPLVYKTSASAVDAFRAGVEKEGFEPSTVRVQGGCSTS